MTPTQIINEILRDYKNSMKHGMTQKQAFEILRVMLVDVLEYEKEMAFDMGQESGVYSVMADLRLLGADAVLERYVSSISERPALKPHVDD